MLAGAMVLVSIATLAAPPVPNGISVEELDQYAKAYQKREKECGPICVWYCLARLGHRVPFKTVLQQAPLTDRGMSVKDVMELVRAFRPELHPKALTGSPKAMETLPVPTILILGNHCVVYEGTGSSKQRIRVFEPIQGKVIEVPREELARYWEGNVIVFSAPSPSPAGVLWLSLLLAMLPVIVWLAVKQIRSNFKKSSPASAA